MLSNCLKGVNEQIHLQLSLIISMALPFRFCLNVFLTCIYFQTILKVNISGVFTERMDFFPFSFIQQYLLSTSLSPSHINVLATTDEVPTHLLELKYFYGGGCGADGRGWGMCHEQLLSTVNRIIVGIGKPEAETRAGDA